MVLEEKSLPSGETRNRRLRQAAGQTVPHVHFHLIPGSIHHLGRHAAQMGDQEKIKALAEKIKAAL